MDDDRQPERLTFDSNAMRRAIALAYQGQGCVEPNPMVGCVIAKDGAILSEGFHERFGGPHAEVQAINLLASQDVFGSTVYVTLEPCSHYGKTPPCVDLLIKLKPARVVIGIQDPFPEVSGSGIEKLRAAGIAVEVGIEREACERLVKPYLKRLSTGLPWLIAKWAMTLDGRMATHSGDSKWITGEAARQHAHRTRGRVDAICIGIETAIHDDPMLTARPPGPRIATRVVMDSEARLPATSRLARTAKEFPTLVCCGPLASSHNIQQLQEHGCEVSVENFTSANDRMVSFLKDLALRGHTNVLVDGGPKLLGGLFDHRLIDEVHVYVATKMVGGHPSHVPLAGRGLAWMRNAVQMRDVEQENIDGDLFVRGFCAGVQPLGAEHLGCAECG